MTPGICQAGGLVLPSSLHISCCCPLAVHTPLKQQQKRLRSLESTGCVQTWDQQLTHSHTWISLQQLKLTLRTEHLIEQVTAHGEQHTADKYTATINECMITVRLYLYTVMTSTFVQLSLTTRNTVLYSKIHSSWNLIHRLPFNHRDEISSSIQSVAYLPDDMIQLIFTILISLVTVPSAEIRPALGKHTWVTVPSLSVIWILSAVQLYLQLVAIRLGWFLVNSTWQTD